MHACADVDGHQRPISFLAALDNHHGFLWPVCDLSLCRVRRFWAGEDDEVGRLMHKPGGAEHARWVFEYDPGRDDDDEVGYKLGEHAFLPGDCVSISGKDGKLQTFRVISVNPVLLSMALAKSFELEINA